MSRSVSLFHPFRKILQLNKHAIVAEEEAPNMNKKFSVHSKFIDDDGKTHLEFDWAFQIDKDW